MTFPLDPDSYLRLHKQRLARDLVTNKRARAASELKRRRRSGK